jgi:hypothetical protein
MSIDILNSHFEKLTITLTHEPPPLREGCLIQDFCINPESELRKCFAQLKLRQLDPDVAESMKTFLSNNMMFKKRNTFLRHILSKLVAELQKRRNGTSETSTHSKRPDISEAERKVREIVYACLLLLLCWLCSVEQKVERKRVSS